MNENIVMIDLSDLDDALVKYLQKKNMIQDMFSRKEIMEIISIMSSILIRKFDDR